MDQEKPWGEPRVLTATATVGSAHSAAAATPSEPRTSTRSQLWPLPASSPMPAIFPDAVEWKQRPLRKPLPPAALATYSEPCAQAGPRKAPTASPTESACAARLDSTDR